MELSSKSTRMSDDAKAGRRALVCREWTEPGLNEPSQSMSPEIVTDLSNACKDAASSPPLIGSMGRASRCFGAWVGACGLRRDR